MGMFFSLSLPWWVFPQPDFMVVRGGHRIALFSLCFACLTSNLLCGGRCCHLCHSLLHASLEEEEFIQNRLTGNCPLTFYHFVGIGAMKVLKYFVSMLKTTGVN